MSPVSPIDRLVRRLPDQERGKPRAKNERVVIYDVRTKAILDKLPFLSIGVEPRYYLVCTGVEVDWEGPASVLKDLATDRVLTLRTRLLLTAEQGKEGTLVAALAEGSSPTHSLSDIVRSSIESFAREKRDAGVDLIGDYYSQEDSIKERLSRDLLAVGLRSEALVTLEGESRLETIELYSAPFPVRVRDSDSELSLRFKAELSVLSDRRIEALLQERKSHQLEQALQKDTKAFFRDQVSLHEFHYELTDKVRDRLRDDLNKALLPFGRTLTFFALETPVERPQEETEQVLHSVLCTIKDTQTTETTVTVNNTIRLQLRDLARWERAGFSSLRQWYEPNLDEIIQDELFDSSYVSLLLDFERKIKGRIQREVKRRAKEVGYSIKHHLVLPDLEPLKLVNGFEVSPSRKYPTLDSRFEVELTIVVTGRIPDLRKIENLLTPQADIQAQIQRAVERVTEQIMHSVAPKRFYLSFKAESPEGEPPLETEIQKAVVQRLRSEFHAEDIQVVPKVLETPLIRRLTTLIKTHHSVDIEMEPLRAEEGIDRVLYRVDFEILGVGDAGWYKFLSRDYGSAQDEVAAIKDILDTEVKSKLETVPPGYLNYRTHREWREIAKLFVQSTALIERAFGLQIQLLGIRRRRSEAEEIRLAVAKNRLLAAAKTDKEAIEKISSHRLTELDQLEAKRAELIAAGLQQDDPEIAELEERMHEVSDQLLHLPTDFGPHLVRGDQPALPSDDQLEDYSDSHKLLEAPGSSAKRITSGDAED